MNSEFKKKYKSEILPAFWSLISDKTKIQHPLEWNSQTKTKPKKNPDLKELNKPALPALAALTTVHMYRKESLLTDSSTAYLNTVHPTKLRVNLNEVPSTKAQTTKKNKQNKTNKTNKSGLRLASLLHLRNEKQKSKTSNVICEYLKTFSKYRKRKTGLLINHNQQIAYNFNSQNLSLSLRGVKPTDAVPFTFAFQKEKEAKTKNITKNIIDHWSKELLSLYPKPKKQQYPPLPLSLVKPRQMDTASVAIAKKEVNDCKTHIKMKIFSWWRFIFTEINFSILLRYFLHYKHCFHYFLVYCYCLWQNLIQ